MKDKELINLAHVRTSHQKETMERIAKDGVCPFCPEHLLKYHTKPIIEAREWWTLTENFAPYEGAKIHLLAIAIPHVKSLADLPPAAGAELISIFSDYIKKHNIPGGSLLMRFGDTEITGGTVSHLHVQFVVGCPRTDSSKKIETRIGYAC